MPSLFTPIRIGALDLPNRIVMAPMSRVRATGGLHEANAMMARYYAQRASAGLIISEGVAVSPMAVGYENVPGIWSNAQIESWRQVTKAVHDAGGQIVMQLWHVGHLSHPDLLGGALPIGPSPVACEGHVSLLRPKRPYPVPRAISWSEIPQVVAEYEHAARNALRAGFDGVEIHAANGYLIEQFLLDDPNQRKDGYGGSILNRARLLFEIVDAVIGVWGADRVGVHLSPRCDRPSMACSDRWGTFAHVLTELDRRRIAFICSREAEGPDSIGPRLKSLFTGAYIANEGFTGPTADACLERGDADAVAFGKPFIANPDLPWRLRHGAELSLVDSETIYATGCEGYVDYLNSDLKIGRDN